MEGRLYLDANVLISIVEAPRQLAEAQIGLLAGIEGGRIAAVSSDLALAECLVRPMTQGDPAGIAAFMGMFEAASFETMPLDRSVMVEAARQRALHRMKLPDAMHVAAAIMGGCGGFVTADRGIRLPDSLRRIAWDALAEPGPGG